MKQRKRFKKVYIEITNVCNLSCSFCPKTKRNYGKITTEQFQYVIDQVKGYTDYVYLHVLGEPLLHTELDALLDIGVAAGLKMQLTTNGTLLMKAKEVLLKGNRIRQMNISLHSFEANEANGSLASYVQSVVDFVRIARETTDMIISIRLWNADSKELTGANKRNQEILTLLQEVFEIEEDLVAVLGAQNSYKLAPRIYLNKEEIFSWPDTEKEVISEEVFCYGLRDQIGILVDGTVVPCCLDGEGEIFLGNIYKTELKDILAGDRAVAIYEGFSNRIAVEELCKRCGYAAR